MTFEKTPLADLWLEDAQNELRLAAHIFEGSFFSATCQHAHTAAEKSLKALKYLSGHPAKDILEHDLKTIFDSLLEAIPELIWLESDILIFRRYSSDVRYINIDRMQLPAEAYNISNAEAALAAASNIFNEASRIAAQA